ncbi:MAG TPA: histidine phosphatase family protein [Hyphomicrobiales bacterium]|nr:histidine phosphatase family protein [Hyphomicrobiales bacterium]
MLTLTLFRHAKSCWDHADLTDFDRPLNERGEHDAPVMGRYLAAHKLIPDLILCSAAKRARATLDLAWADWPVKPHTEYSEALYLATQHTMLGILHNVEGHPAHVMMIGHNPGMHAFAMGMAGTGEADARYALSSKYPTAAIASITFDAKDWSDVTSGNGTLTLFISPKQIDAR